MFWIVLFFAKIYVFFADRFSKQRSDLIGVLAYKLCPDFLARLAKPEICIMVTGTNGKTTTTSLVANMLKNAGYKVGYTYWGANMLAGHIKTMLDCVTFFNKPKVDACVLETDELLIHNSMPQFKPQYLLVTNICRDSIRRNAYPDYIFDRMDKGIGKYKDVKVVLHANDPLSSGLGAGNPRIYIGAEKIYSRSAYAGFSNEFLTCPNCNSTIEYEFRHYRHVGRYKCPKCGLTNPESKYIWEGTDEGKLVLNGEKYHIISNDIFNLYNEIMIIGLFLEMGFEPAKIDELLKSVHIPESREGFDSCKGINIYRKCGKGQNGTAPSIVFEGIMEKEGDKEFVLIMDAEIGKGAHATMTWLYDNDFELLNDESVKKIVITGENTLDYKLRLLLAGLDESRLIICEDYKEAHKYLSLDGSDIYLIVDIDYSKWGIEVSDNIVRRIEAEISE
ncbi:MAG: DUF1727 domain-containing protein [Mogibacterium sp.]|nr:DUF1727 domain-containing protein [Mogibacterium sp.]